MRLVERILLGSILIIAAATALGLVFNAVRGDGLSLFSYEGCLSNCLVCQCTCTPAVTHGEIS